MVRGQVKSKKDEVHLGYVFNDAPLDKGGLRYTVNSAVLDFVPYEQLTAKQQLKFFPELYRK